jgi:predicted RecA/RadA family phage recombinase
MKNYIQPGKSIAVVVAGANIVSGAGRLVGTMLGVATKSALIGETVIMDLEGVFELPKLAADDMAVLGAPLYWDDTNKWLTLVASTHNQVATVHEVAAAATTKVRARLGLCFVA